MTLRELLFRRVKRPLDEHAASGARVTKALVRRAVSGMNDDGLPLKDLRVVERELFASLLRP